MSVLTGEEAGQVLLILSETVWPDVDVRTGADFVVGVQQEGFTEYRFGGILGMGGKFYSAHGKWYVSCYPEHRTEERDSKIAQTNVLLETLRDHYRSVTQ